MAIIARVASVPHLADGFALPEDCLARTTKCERWALAVGSEVELEPSAKGAFAERKVEGPLLLLLDINMPRIDGIEALTAIRANKATATLPVIMLTTTDDPREIERCYGPGCNAYITKPVGYDDFAEAVKWLGLFLQIVQMPQPNCAKVTCELEASVK